MHPRQRSPRGFYAPEYRHRDAGFGRGHPTRRGGGGGGAVPGPNPGGDIFVEAGRLAAEYLVSQGLLPPNVLKWQNHKKEFVPVEGGRTSALARLGNAVDGRRKLGFEEFGQKGRRRGSFSRSNGLDWGRDYRRNGAWSDRNRGSLEFKDDDDAGSDATATAVAGGSGSVIAQQDEVQHQKVDNILQTSNLNEFVPRSEDGDDLDGETDKDKDRLSVELMDLKQSSSGSGKDTGDVVDVEFVKSSRELENVSTGVKEAKDDVADKDGGAGDDDNEKLSVAKDLSAQSSDQENSSSSRVFTDLVSLCKSVNVPTRTRSSVARKNSKAHPVQNSGDESACDIGDLHGPEVLAEIEPVKGSSSDDLLSDRTYDLVHLDSEDAKVEPVDAAEDMEELQTESKAEEIQSVGSQSGQERGYAHDNNQESSGMLPEYGSCSPVAEERGEKRVAEDDDVREDTKRLREWLPSLVTKTEGYYLHNDPIEVKESPGEDETSHIDEVTMASDQVSLMSGSQFTEGGDRPFLPCSDDKASLPSSFRTCDLNLIEASEVHENHAGHPVLIYSPPVSETKKAVPVDVDLSMNHTSVSGKFSTHGTNGKEIEVIDLEDDCIQEEKSVDNMDRKTETMFQGLEGFSNHPQNTADIHELMISELLGTDFPNCSSVPGDINSVHNEMDLHNETGTLAEDDSIYMSLGELSFLRPWEQPPSQDYQKHF